MNHLSSRGLPSTDRVIIVVYCIGAIKGSLLSVGGYDPIYYGVYTSLLYPGCLPAGVDLNRGSD